MSKLSRTKKIFFPVIVTIVLIIFSFGIVEIGLRFIYDKIEIRGGYWGNGSFIPNEQTGYMHKPSYEGYVFRKNAFKTFVRINSEGLRDSHLEEQMAYSKKVLILGDSFAFGLGVEGKKIFPYLLQKKMNAHDIGVINAAQSGYSVEQECLFGITLQKKYSPVLIILALFAENDVRGDFFKEYKNVEVKYGTLLKKDRVFKNPISDFFRTHSYLWILIESGINRRKKNEKFTWFKSKANKSTESVLKPTLKSLSRMNQYCKTNNALFSVMMIPPKRGRTVFDERIKKFLMSENIPFLNITSLKKRVHYLKKDGHWNDKGHKKSSDMLYNFIIKLLQKPNKP